ncbi:RNB domain-containing ribonuclease, partial [Herbaspirillum sp. B65]
NDAHRLIEECMLAANVCAADLLKRHDHPALYRIHAGPTKEKLTQLRTFLKQVGLHLGGGDTPSASDYAELMPKVKARPDAVLIQTMLLRSMQQAVYSPDNIGHFGLSYESYAHFTSPIRRYPDLLTHRAIKAVLQGKRYEPKGIDSGALNTSISPAARKAQALQRATDKAAGKKPRGESALAIWEALGLHCSANERRADEASRDVEAWLKCYFIRDKLGEEFTGTISGVATFGIFVQLDALYIEGLVHVTELGADYFQYDEARHELRGERTGIRYQLTDRVTVQVSRVDLDARKIDLSLVNEPGIRTLIKNEAKRAETAARGKSAGSKPTAASQPAARGKKAAAPKPATAAAKPKGGAKAKAGSTTHARAGEADRKRAAAKGFNKGGKKKR